MYSKNKFDWLSKNKLEFIVVVDAMFMLLFIIMKRYIGLKTQYHVLVFTEHNTIN